MGFRCWGLGVRGKGRTGVSTVYSLSPSDRRSEEVVSNSADAPVNLVEGFGVRVQGRGSRVEGRGFRVLGSGFRVLGWGWRVEG